MGLYRSKWDAILERTTRRAFVENNSPAYQKPFFIGIIGFILGYALIEGFRNGIANAGNRVLRDQMAKIGPRINRPIANTTKVAILVFTLFLIETGLIGIACYAHGRG